jgi:hypothetical protein
MNEHPFDDFQFSIPLTSENEKYLKSKKYEKRSGTCAYPENRKVFRVVPFKKWYWEDTYRSQVHIDVKKTKKIVRSLEISGDYEK